MKRALPLVILLLVAVPLIHAETAPDAPELTRLVNEFLAGASHDDAAIHDRFWADDLIYTGSSGRRIGKADILAEVRGAPAPDPKDPVTTFTAEDVRIQQYGDTAVVAFRLVGTTVSGERRDVMSYLNTGTFVKHDAKWQAVAWQATKMPRGEEEKKKEAASVEAALHAALLAGDARALEGLLDESFVWTHETGEIKTRKDLLAAVSSGLLKYAVLQASDVTVSVYGDTAVARGKTTRQRSAFPGDKGKGDPAPFPSLFTLTLGNKGEGFKALAMHTSRLPGPSGKDAVR